MTYEALAAVLNPQTEEEIELLRAAAECGVKVEQIGSRLHVTVSGAGAFPVRHRDMVFHVLAVALATESLQ